MLYVKNEEKEFGILFRHDRVEKEFPADAKKGLPKRKQSHPFRTTCAIFEDEVAIGTGVAKIDSRDQFQYEKGRELSLKAAMKAAGIGRNLRTSLWEGYNMRSWHPKKEQV